MSALVTVKRFPSRYQEPAYWHATCKPCRDLGVDCYPALGSLDGQQSSEAFEQVLAWATNHAFNCPAILVEKLQLRTGHRWCPSCQSIDGPCKTCTGRGCSACDWDGIEHAKSSECDADLPVVMFVDLCPDCWLVHPKGACDL